MPLVLPLTKTHIKRLLPSMITSATRFYHSEQSLLTALDLNGWRPTQRALHPCAPRSIGAAPPAALAIRYSHKHTLPFGGYNSESICGVGLNEFRHHGWARCVVGSGKPPDATDISYLAKTQVPGSKSSLWGTGQVSMGKPRRDPTY